MTDFNLNELSPTPSCVPERSSPSVTYSTPDVLCSVCSAKDLEVWKYTGDSLLKFVDAKHYQLIVPNDELKIFRAVTDKRFSIIPESVYVSDIKKILIDLISPRKQGRVGWYLQQFIKLAVLGEARKNENYVIWDADTVPRRKIDFFRTTGEVEFYSGTEVHTPYFDLIEKLLGFGKVANFSFIAQCFPCKGIWFKSFVNHIEGRFSGGYLDSLIRLIDFEQSSGFSEYETLGSFVFKSFPDQILIKSDTWFRDGCPLIGHPDNMQKPPYERLISHFDHITFEESQEPFSILAVQDKSFKSFFLEAETKLRPNLKSFLNFMFESGRIRTIVQIGANDGIQNDPLREYLSISSSYNALLVEPIPFYAERLEELYLNRNDVKVIRVVAGSIQDKRELFFIPPKLADEMNGDGPPNNWAHGQGSFDKSTVIHWIKENAFRGQEYLARMDDYIAGIISIQVDVVRTDTLLGKNRSGLLLIVDVQGFEFEVLDGIDWGNPPEWVIVEDDLGKTFAYLSYFTKRGYVWVAGDHDKVFTRASSFSVQT